MLDAQDIRENPQNYIKVTDTLLELVINTSYIKLVDVNRFSIVKKNVQDIVGIDDDNLEYEILKVTEKVSDLHNLLQHEAEQLLVFKTLLKKCEVVWTRYFKRQLTDEHYAKYGRQNDALTAADAKMAVDTRSEITQISLSIDRLSRIVKYIEDELNILQYSYTKSIDASIKYRIFKAGG